MRFLQNCRFLDRKGKNLKQFVHLAGIPASLLARGEKWGVIRKRENKGKGRKEGKKRKSKKDTMHAKKTTDKLKT